MQFGWMDIGGPDPGRFTPLPGFQVGREVFWAAWLPAAAARRRRRRKVALRCQGHNRWARAQRGAERGTGSCPGSPGMARMVAHRVKFMIRDRGSN
jgi:hypothetical protein